MPRPLARRPLVVEVRDVVELLVREQPEAEQRRREVRVHVSRRQLHERRERQRHLPQLAVEGRVAACAARAEARGRFVCPASWVVVVVVVVMVVVMVAAPAAVARHVGGGWWVVVAALVHPEVAHIMCMGVGVRLV